MKASGRDQLIPHGGSERTDLPRITPRHAVPRTKAPSFAPVGAIQRGLQILRSLNQHNIATIADIHQDTGIPKPTIIRILETLIHDGYVIRDSMCAGYYLTSKTADIHQHEYSIAHLIEVARPVVVELTQRFHWPVGIGSLVGDVVVIQYSTAEISPWSRSITVGKRANIRFTAMGRAVLAFCSEVDRDRLLLLSRPADSDWREEAKFLRLLQEARESGYTIRAEQFGDPVGSVAVPIHSGGELLAVMNFRYYPKAVSTDAAKAALVQGLKDAARAIEQELQHRDEIDLPHPMSVA